MSYYMIRYRLLKPIRLAIRGLSWLVGRVPHTTYGEIAEMHPGPCSRCIGRRVIFP